ncbi:methylated-DNA--[protein]-cysteine S-methyltransferase [Corynebacterium auris]|uniref:methylated-DNA--[protein]-cysteine S-methyltransferase n=1 Tax=Corynebacterium auris TaxID=44750 RepID=UPI0025B38FC6|nr:methylated-DNA--[protein]-cysteine S-methyltransferase [Corynebacterium auris]WJY68688.1 Methylated-DNA--protein-cysteine methyltransferase, constitutive [Corynebacterium auris]
MKYTSWTVVHTPVGELMLVSSDAGLAHVVFECEDFALRRSELGLSGAQAPGAEAARQLEEYFAGRRRSFDLALDWGAGGGFHRRVQRALAEIPYGETRTYSEFASHLGSPRAVRAVGAGCARNPLPIVSPCHRVVRSDGSLGGYRGGLEVKQRLLELEAA